MTTRTHKSVVSFETSEPQNYLCKREKSWEPRLANWWCHL